MILNAYAMLDGFVTLLRLLLGILLVGLTLSALRRQGRSISLEERRLFEDRCYLVVLLAGVLLVLNLASWPFFYLLLQSYVKEWPGVMCIYGVTQVGLGSYGLSRFLPGLVKTLQVLKPVLVFASGSWFVLYLVNRRTATAPLWTRVLWVILGVGMLAALDAAAEAAYLVIPKREAQLAVGCCAEAFDADVRATCYLPHALLGKNYYPYLYRIFWGSNGLMVLVLATCIGLIHSGRSLAWLAGLLLGGVLCTVLNAVFLVEIAAPALLRLPYHHCPYDLVPEVPESVLGIALFVLAIFCIGWACVVAGLGNNPETRQFARQTVVKVLSLGLFAYLSSLVFMTVELALV
jgi:hypothetical protein